MATPNERAPSPLDRAFLTDEPAAGTLILVRHGQQRWPDPDTATVDEWIDPPLSELGRRQADAVGAHLAGESIDAIYSSRLSRAHDTGLAIAAHHHLEVEIIDELAEIGMFADLGDGARPVDVIGEQKLAGMRQRFAQTRRWDSYAHTERSDDFRRRIGWAIESVLARHDGHTVVVACHGGVINAYLADLLGLTEDMFFRPYHASTHRLVFRDDRRVIDSLNGQSHLRHDGLLSH